MTDAAHPVAPGGGAFGRVARALAFVITGWAALGALVLALLAVVAAASAVSNLVFHAPIAADYELTKHFVAIAIFAFLPYCQLVGANVSVDIFTERMGPRAKAAMAGLAAALAVALAVLLLRQMGLGFASYRRMVEVTPVLGLPLWTAFPPILVSLALLAAAGVLTLVDAVRAIGGQPPLTSHEPRAEDHL